MVVTSELVVAEATRLLNGSGMLRVDRSRYPSWPSHAVVFEDRYSIVSVWSYSSIVDLVSQWGEAQDFIVEFLGASIVNTDPKSWDAYLILIAADGVPESLVADVSRIRLDTRRVRKLVITADDLPRLISDALQLTPGVRSALAPVLELELDLIPRREDPLASIPSRLASRLHSDANISSILTAFDTGEPLMEALHRAINAPTAGETKT